MRGQIRGCFGGCPSEFVPELVVGTPPAYLRGQIGASRRNIHLIHSLAYFLWLGLDQKHNTSIQHGNISRLPANTIEFGWEVIKVEATCRPSAFVQARC